MKCATTYTVHINMIAIKKRSFNYRKERVKTECVCDIKI